MMEAMASGLAVIGTAVGEVPSIIDNERTGLVLPPGNRNAIADAIQRLDDDYDIRKKNGNGW